MAQGMHPDIETDPLLGSPEQAERPIAATPWPPLAAPWPPPFPLHLPLPLPLHLPQHLHLHVHRQLHLTHETRLL